MSHELIKRVDDLVDVVKGHDQELNRARERSAADLARFEGVQKAIEGQRKEFHTDLEASETRMRADINRVDGNVTKLGNGQAVILRAIQERDMPTSASPGHDPVPITTTGFWSIPVWIRVIIVSAIAIGTVIGAAVLAVIRGGI